MDLRLESRAWRGFPAVLSFRHDTFFAGTTLGVTNFSRPACMSCHSKPAGGKMAAPQ
jgi:hypothetical protein